MATRQKATPTTATASDGFVKLLEPYGCGPVRFTGTDDALYERHLLFDNVLKPAEVCPRERFEAVARSVRDVLSQRWVLTEDTYARENAKRVYYLRWRAGRDDARSDRSEGRESASPGLDPPLQSAFSAARILWTG